MIIDTYTMKKTVVLLSLAILMAVSPGAAAQKKTDGVRPPTMGWSSWNAFMLEISDAVIMDHADLMVSTGLKDAGYTIVNIDDGFFGYRDAEGNMIPHVTRFPNGIKHVVDHIHGLGLRAGIYTDAGEMTCGRNYNKEINPAPVGIYGHEEQDAERYFNEWGFDFIKIDYCGGHRMQADEEQMYTNIRNVINRVAKHPVELNICRWDYPGTWVSGVSESWRISGDIRPKWAFIRNIVAKNMYLSAYAGGGHYNDMDMLALGYNKKPSPFNDNLPLGLTYEEEEAHFGLWCIFSSPLLLGCDVRYIPEETMKIITNPELIAVNQDPLGLQAYVVQHEGEGYIFAKDILTRFGKVRAVALYNPSEEDITFTLRPEEIDLAGPIKVRDLCARKDLGTGSSLQMTLHGHSAKILRVEGRRRLEQTALEAEWGYCPAFTAIESEGGKYVPTPAASMGAAVYNLGGSAKNCLQWNDVYSAGGKYHLTLTTLPEKDAEIVLTVNGAAQTLRIPAAGGKPQKTTVAVKLRKGQNRIEVGNPDAALPPVDRVTLERL